MLSLHLLDLFRFTKVKAGSAKFQIRTTKKEAIAATVISSKFVTVATTEPIANAT